MKEVPLTWDGGEVLLLSGGFFEFLGKLKKHFDIQLTMKSLSRPIFIWFRLKTEKSSSFIDSRRFNVSGTST
jgi:hypothetical protein